MTSRLFQAFPGLSAQFARADAERKRRAVAVACAVAVHESGLEAAEVQRAIASLQSDGLIDSSVKAKIDALTEALDEAYFALVDEADGVDAHALAIFSKARASAALGFALVAGGESFDESLYEAISATESEAQTVERLGAMFREGGDEPS